MGIPALTAEGHLPPGRHASDLAELKSVFVDQAPHREWRQGIYSALEAWLGLVLPYVPGALLWIDGGFVTHKSEAPKDVDVVVIPARGQLTSDVEAALEPFMTRVDHARGLHRS